MAKVNGEMGPRERQGRKRSQGFFRRMGCAVVSGDLSPNLMPSDDLGSPGSEQHRIPPTDASLRRIKQSHRTYLKALGFLSLGMVVQVVEIELVFENDLEVTLQMHALKAVIFALTILGLMFLVQYYIESLRYFRQQRIVDESDDLWTSGLWVRLAFELLVCSIHAPPGLEGTFSVYNAATEEEYVHSFDEVMGFFSLLRVYLWFRGVHFLAGFSSNMTFLRLAHSHHVQLSPMFTFKFMLYKFPLRTLAVLFPALIVIMGFALRIAEQSAQPAFKYLMNNWWLVSVTMTTVGYGEIYPKSTGGRAVAIMVCILGNILLAVLLTTADEIMAISDNSKEVADGLVEYETGQKIRNIAADIVTQAIRYSALLKMVERGERVGNLRKRQRQVLEQMARDFHTLKRRAEFDAVPTEQAETGPRKTTAETVLSIDKGVQTLNENLSSLRNDVKWMRKVMTQRLFVQVPPEQKF